MREHKHFYNPETVIRLTMLFFCGALFFLGLVLWQIQVKDTAEYSSSLDRQSIRRVRVAGARGRITDRNGSTLAENRPSYCLAVYIEEIRQPGRWMNTVDEVERMLHELSAVIEMPVNVTSDDILRHIQRRLPLPFVAWRDLSPRALARWAESPKTFPGVDIHVEAVRIYPEERLMGHVIGHIGRADLIAAGETGYHFYEPEMEGKLGVERSFNDLLSGASGGRLIRVDASGMKHEELVWREPQSGSDLQLTLDLDIQRLLESVLQGVRGAAVLVDVNNGDIIALASEPVFDPNIFSVSLSAAEYRELIQDPGRPLFNRAINAYPPGSIIKPLVGLAVVGSGRVSINTEVYCSGVFNIGGFAFHCWRRSGHGALSLRAALAQSCNVYYYQNSLTAGYDGIYHMAAASGIGRLSGIRLPGESAGLLPDDAWKRSRNPRDGWRAGDTCNVSIGQGALLATPLQMALLTAAIANGGTIYRPRISFTEPEAVVSSSPAWQAPVLQEVRLGMYDSVNSERGTGRRARIHGVNIAGKTGTAQYGPQHERLKHAWMIAYAPYEVPRYAMAIIIENAESGGLDAAPRVQQVMSHILERDGFIRPEGGRG